MTYDPKGRRCPVHPTLPHPCAVCATPGTTATTPADSVIADVNWENQAETPYNMPMPNRDEDYHPFASLAEHLGLDDHLDDPALPAPPPPLPPEI